MEIIVVVSKKGFKDKQTRSFESRLHGRLFKGFVVREGDSFFAYQNLCQHLPITLDLNDNSFFSHDKKHLQCQMHGAMYEIQSGKCIAGPCIGSNLRPLEIRDEATVLHVVLPKSSEE